MGQGGGKCRPAKWIPEGLTGSGKGHRRVPTRSEQIGVIHLIKAIKTGPEKFKPAKPPANFAAQLSEELKRLRELRYRQEQLWEWTDVSANSLTKAWPKGNRVPLLCAQIGVLALLRELK